MTRMIDADKLLERMKKGMESGSNLNGTFDLYIEHAPTIEPSGDLISRKSALAEFRDGRDVYDIMESIEELPSAEAEQVTGKLNKRDDSLLKSDSDECKEQKSKLDLISRSRAIKEVSEWATDILHPKNLIKEDAIGILESLPSAEPKTGEWMRLEREENVYDLHGVPTWGVNYMCDKCGFITTAIQDHFGQYKWCPSCGADMRGEKE